MTQGVFSLESNVKLKALLGVYLFDLQYKFLSGRIDKPIFEVTHAIGYKSYKRTQVQRKTCYFSRSHFIIL